MKTFDEALATVIKADHEVMYADVDKMTEEHLANPNFTSSIKALEKALQTRDSFTSDDLCEFLHRAFLFGLLVGMEMEKAGEE